MTRQKRQLIQKVVRLHNALTAIAEQADEAYDMDSRFDGGEFSGPALRRWVDQQEASVARRLGFASVSVADDIWQTVR